MKKLNRIKEKKKKNRKTEKKKKRKKEKKKKRKKNLNNQCLSKKITLIPKNRKKIQNDEEIIFLGTEIL